MRILEIWHEDCFFFHNGKLPGVDLFSIPLTIAVFWDSGFDSATPHSLPSPSVLSAGQRIIRCYRSMQSGLMLMLPSRRR